MQVAETQSMSTHAVEEPSIDVSLNYYVEEQALAIALDKAVTGEEREKVKRLLKLRSELMEHRDAFMQEATLKRHARGEIYSKARVAAINAMGPNKAELDANVKIRFARQPSCDDVLREHARIQFVFPFVAERFRVKDMPPDIVDSARRLQCHEERFAKAWIAAAGNAEFEAELRVQQREALIILRTNSRPIYFVNSAALECLDDEDASELGKAWSKLDKLADSLGIEPLSKFIAFDEEDNSGNASAATLLPLVERLLSAIEKPGEKFPSKKKVAAVLRKLQNALVSLKKLGAGGHFEVDI